MKLNEIIYISFRIQGASSFNVLLVYHRRDKRKKNARPLVLLRKENQKQRLFSRFCAPSKHLLCFEYSVQTPSKQDMK